MRGDHGCDIECEEDCVGRGGGGLDVSRGKRRVPWSGIIATLPLRPIPRERRRSVGWCNIRRDQMSRPSPPRTKTKWDGLLVSVTAAGGEKREITPDHSGEHGTITKTTMNHYKPTPAIQQAPTTTTHQPCIISRPSTSTRSHSPSTACLDQTRADPQTPSTASEITMR